MLVRRSKKVLKILKKSAEDAGNAIKDSAKDLEKNVKEGVDRGTEDAGNAIKDLGDKMSGEKGQ